MGCLKRYGRVLAVVGCVGCAAGSGDQSGGSVGDSGPRKVLPSGQDDSSSPVAPAPTTPGTPGTPPALDVDAASDTDASATDDVAQPAQSGDAAAGGPDALGIDWDALFPPPPLPASDASTSADGLSCGNQGCFDIFDCALYHPAEFSACKYTQCVNLVCQ